MVGLALVDFFNKEYGANTTLAIESSFSINYCLLSSNNF